MKEIVSVAIGSSERDFDFKTEFLGHKFRVRRFGADGRFRKAKDLLDQFGADADMIGISGFLDYSDVGVRSMKSKQMKALEKVVPGVPKTTGSPLKRIMHQWLLSKIQEELGGFFNNAKVLFYSGMSNYNVATAMYEYTQNIKFADPITSKNIPKLLSSIESLEKYASGTHELGNWMPTKTFTSSIVPISAWNKHVLTKAAENAMAIVGPVQDVQELPASALAGKVVITSAVTEADIKIFNDKGVDVVIDDSPQPFNQVVGLNVLDAMIVTALQKTPENMTVEEYFDIIDELDFQPKIIYPSGKVRRKNRFAFVIHPLSQENFKNLKVVDMASKIAPPVFMDAVEAAMAYSPPILYSKVEGIKSPTGIEAEGWLLSIGGTPKQILSRPPEFTYRRLLDAAKMAEKLGAQIMGLGAFTKVVGDNGVTVAKRANIPITSGNSYSASGALWAASDAIRKLGLLEIPEGSKKLPVKAMVIGATGSIGAVCSRLLAFVVEEVHLIDLRTNALLWLRDEIHKDCPDTKVVISTKANETLSEMDMIVTSTSGAGKKILDIMKVKPGCVITDVARPLDLPASEVKKRPDVLVIESGEIYLPGKVKMENIGFKDRNVVFACLAETIVLCLEGRFEIFTIGRKIQWEKVKEIYQMGLKHGMTLASISGVNGVYTDKDIKRVRNAALKAMKKEEKAKTKSKAKTKAKK
jgi:predicted amino acid dehydrogenase